MKYFSRKSKNKKRNLKNKTRKSKKQNKKNRIILPGSQGLSAFGI